jgi:hypothetical protein
VQDVITDIEVQNLRKAQESVPFAREKYEADKVLDNRFATDCAKEVIAAEVLPEEGLSVSQPTKAIRPCAVCFILSFSCKSVT